jgi:hypothetical protein
VEQTVEKEPDFATPSLLGMIDADLWPKYRQLYSLRESTGVGFKRGAC